MLTASRCGVARSSQVLVVPLRPRGVRGGVRYGGDDGKPRLVVLVNPDSGTKGEHPGAELATAWPAARQVFIEPGGDLTEQLAAELDATEAPVRALGVAGGRWRWRRSQPTGACR